MQGYRTLAVFAIVTVAGIFGRHLSPEAIQTYATDLISTIGILGMSLRLITKTPMGMKEVKNIEARLNLGTEIEDLIGKFPEVSLDEIINQVQSLKNGNIPSSQVVDTAGIPVGVK